MNALAEAQPHRCATVVGTAAGTVGLAVSVGGLASPLIGRLADATSLRTALAPLVLMPVLSRLLLRTLSEPGPPRPPTGAPAAETGAGSEAGKGGEARPKTSW
ncbi:hypothetical protein GCM10010260_45690 [Streptomyces filipinensis]|uniref:Uncharacterized protein n=1 Tax=Streptomyces filipinensis TaxID=66887 RepID=A0A918MD26_9ACTN|nr:hypothetical protein GCM10010260_45690 [Streptomyces filipinensis]